MKLIYSAFIILIFTVNGCSKIGTLSCTDTTNIAKTRLLYNQYIEGETPNIAQLNLFFSKMPKGGDLHHHYSGSIYAETYLDWVKSADYCICEDTLKICKKKTSSCISVDKLRSNTAMYKKLLSLWSNNDYQNHYHKQPPPDSNFFNTFGYFGSISGYSYYKGLHILKSRAIKENVSYIETMLKSTGYSYKKKSFDKQLKKTVNDNDTIQLLGKLADEIHTDPNFQKSIDKFIKLIEKAHINIDDDQFMMRYQTYASRNSTPSIVFSNLYSAFKAADQSKLLVGVNIVGPENGIVAIDDYHLHMLMFSYLKNKFPKVNRALHAGELTLGMVRPKNLKFHIAQAIKIVGAQRIGHGVDLPYEDDAINLLKKLKETSAIEINLTSNEFILGVKGREHPYLIYSAHKIPIVISTDDSGVSRNNLSKEYVLLASRYKPDYKTIKKYVYNSIKRSFLSDPHKKQLIKSLDRRFTKFESEMADVYGSILN